MEDQKNLEAIMMTSIAFTDLAKEIIDLYRRLDA